MNITIGQKVRFFRRRAGLSQLGLENELLASTGTISRIESGRVNPTKETIQGIADALDLNILERAFLFDIDLSQAITYSLIKVLEIKNLEDFEKPQDTVIFWSKLLEIDSNRFEKAFD